MTTAGIDPTATVPRPIIAGPEMAALARFFPDATWVGTIESGGMGPGSPVMTCRGRGSHQLIQDGRWIVGNYAQNQYLLDGTFVLTWQLHWVVGWDPVHHEYQATFADNYGHAGLMRGQLDGTRLAFQTPVAEPMAQRMSWDASNPADIVWRNESSVDGVHWALIESYHMSPA